MTRLGREPPPLVAHVIYALGTGGLENGLVNILNRMPADRYRHAIVCLTEAHAFAGRLHDRSIPIVELHKRPGHDLALYGRLWRALRRLRPAIVHSRNLAALEMQAVTLALPGVRRVHGEHGRDVYDLDGSNRRYNRLRRALRPLIHRYVAVSRDLAGWLEGPIGVPPERISQIYNGVDQERFRPGEGGASLPSGFLPEVDPLVIGTVGRLAEVKDQRTLVDAFARLLQRAPALRDRARLVLVGDGPMRESLQRRIDEHGLGKLAWISGDRDDVDELLRAMHLFVLPSLGEGISNTILEAMATGLPVIATRIGGNPELVEEGDNGLLVPVGDADALAEALARLADNPDERRRMGAAGLQRVRDTFNWDRAVAEYQAVYDRVLGR